MATPRQLRALRNFIYHAGRVENYSVRQMVESGQVRSAVHWAIGEPTTVETAHPTDEQIGGYILALRFFMMSNEDTSFQNMDAMLQSLNLPADIVSIFTTTRQKLNQWLDANSPLGFGDGPLTNRKVLDTFLYGEFAHTNKPATQAEFTRWKRHPTFYPLLKTHMIGILGKYVHFLREGSRACSLALKSLGETETH